MKLLFTSLSALLLLTACLSPTEQEARMRDQETADHNECLALGFRPQSEAYGDCRLRLKEMRLNANSPVYYPYVGVGYHHRYHHW
jgi:hypothetical protein